MGAAESLTSALKFYEYALNSLKCANAEAEIKRKVFLILFRFLTILCIDIVTSLNKKKARIKYRSETIAVLVLWCSGDIESNPGPPCDDLRDFCKKMISLLVIRYWESKEGKQQSSADYKKLPDGWPEDAWFGDPSKCNKPERDEMLNILLDTCTQQGVDVPNDWLSLAEKYRHASDKNCGKTEKERIAGELRVWLKNLRSKEIVEQTFYKLLDVPVQDQNLIIAQIFDNLKRYVPDLHSDILGSQTVTEKNNVDLMVHNLEYGEQTADTSLNLSNPSRKGDTTQNYDDSNPAMIPRFNDTTIKKDSMYQTPSHTLERYMLGVQTSMLSAENTNSADHDEWLDDIIVDSLSSYNEEVFLSTHFLKTFDNIEQNNDYIEQNFDNIGHVDDACRNKGNHNKRKPTIEVGDDMRPPLAKHPAMSGSQISGCFEGAPRLETERMGDTTLDDITQVIESDANCLDLWD